MFPFIPTGGSGSNYTISRSLRFRSSASAYLSRTQGSATSTTTGTWSGWCKRGKLGSQQFIWSSSNYDFLRFDAADTITIAYLGNLGYVSTSAVYRDPSAWYHITLVFDTTNTTAVNRLRLYVNGVLQTLNWGATPQTQNATFQRWNVSSYVGDIGDFQYDHSAFFDGYMAECYWIDGQALTPSSFGAFNAKTGVWQPAKYTGSYGTNGFYLPFSNNASTTTLGADASGNGNNWTTNNISLTAGSTYDSMTDVPTLTSATAANYPVINPLDRGTSYYPSLSNGNLYYVAANNTQNPARGTLAVTTGKYYFEATIVTRAYNPMVGVMTVSSSLGTGDNFKSLWGTQAAGWSSYTGGDNGIVSNGSNSSYGTAMASGDLIMVAFDVDNGKLWVGKNGTWNNSANPAAGTGNQATFAHTDPITPFFDGSQTGGSADTWAPNFGQRPFTYTPPSGYVALNTYNLPTPTISNGANYMAATTYVGNGSTQSISNAVNGVSFQPDLVWIKVRNLVTGHLLEDSVRGAGLVIRSNETTAEAGTGTYGNTVTSFNSNGFSLGNDAAIPGGVNGNGNTYVGWQWKANGAAVTNTAGTITSQVSANTSAAFSIVKYTGQSGGGSWGHGLGVEPKFIIFKRYTAGQNWFVFTKATGAWRYFEGLNTTTASIDYSSFMSASSTVVTLPNIAEYNTDTGSNYLAYCFADVAGYSAFGSYTGNGSTDGPFVYLGFRPRWVMIKRSSSTGNWELLDTSRNPYNDTNLTLQANLSDAEGTGAGGNWGFNILSNGLKIRGINSEINTSGQTYIYACFAENPFKTSLAR